MANKRRGITPEEQLESARLQEEMANKLAQLSALQETNRALVSTLELDDLLELIIQQAATLLHADGGILNLVDWDRREDEVYACTGSARTALGLRSSLDGSLSGWVTMHNQPVISNRVGEDPRVDRRSTSVISPLHNTAVAPLAIKDQVIGTLVLVDKHGGCEDFEQTDLDLLVSFANQAAAAIENARLFRAEQRRAEQFRVIGEVGQSIASAVDVDHLLEQMARLIQQAFGYTHVGVGLVEGDEVVSKAEAGAYAGPYLPARVKLGQGHWGRVALSGEPYLSADVTKDPDYYPEPGAEMIRSQLFVPLKSKQAVIGVLSVSGDQLNAFDESDLIVLQSLANQAAASVENIRYYERVQRQAVMEERSRLARELHDAVTQTIFSASLLAEALPEVWAKDPNQGMHLARELHSMSRGALAEMRTLLLELRPAALAEAQIDDLLHQLGEAVGGREGIPVLVTIDGQGPLPTDVKIALYRITQEALNNVVKHAGAAHVTVHLCYSCSQDMDPELPAGLIVLLIVRDDGCGFDPTQIQPDHLGLGIMQERAEAIGASLTIDSHLGEGTQITVLWEQSSGQEIV